MPLADPLGIETSDPLGIDKQDPLGVEKPSQPIVKVGTPDPAKMSEPMPSNMTEPLVKAPSFPEFLSKIGSAVMAPVEEAGAKVFTTLRSATSGDVPPSSYQPAEIKPGVPMLNLPQVSPEDARLLPKPLQVVAGGANAINKAISGLTTPGNALLAPVAGVEGLAKPIATGFLANTIASEPEAIQTAWRTYNDPNATATQKSEAIANAAVINPAFAALLTHGVMAKEVPPPQQGPIATGEVLQTPKGATPPPVDNLEDVPTIPSAGPTFAGIKDADIPKIPKASVPETPPEPERDINISQEVRNSGAKTIADIQRLYPQANGGWGLSREQARVIRNAAYPNAVYGVDETGKNLLTAQPEQQSGATAPSPAIEPERETAPAPVNEPTQPVSEPTIPPASEPPPAPVEDVPAPERSEQSPPVEQPKAPPPTSPGDTGYGIAQRVREDRAKFGTSPEIEPGEGISAEEAATRGRELLKNGYDVDKEMANFEKTGQTSGELVSAARAKGEQLAKTASDIQASKGVDSPEFKAALQASFDWDTRTKPLATAAHEQMMAHQGHTELDTGNFVEMARAHYETTGRDFTPQQAKDAEILSNKVKGAVNAEESAKAKVLDEISKQEGTPAQKSVADKISAALDKAAEAAYARIRSRAGRVSAGLDPVDLADHAIFGAAKIAKGAVDFARWSAEMVKDLGDYVKPHLQQIWEAANKELGKRQSGGGVKKELTLQQQVWKRAKDLIANGENDFDDIRHKVAREMGLPAKDVTRILSENQSVKRMSNEMYKAMSDSRRLKQQANNWLRNQQTPGWLKFTREVPRAFFAAKVFGHGTVGMITHAGLNVFNPLAWKTYFPEFLRQFPMAVKTPFHSAKAFHEAAMQDLMRDPNYVTARRAGLANDPFRYADDYQNQTMKSFIEKLDKLNPISGSRGFDALKTFRQARFNQIWNEIPEEQRTPDMAKVVADAVNHSSGVVKTTLPEWMQAGANLSLFAPKLEMSRWAWLIGDPAKAATTFTKWTTATPVERMQAIGQVKEKAAIAATYFSLLAANQGLLKAMGSSQSVNMTDPTKSDFLSFKADGHKIGIIGPMIGMVRMLADLWHISRGQRSPQEKRDTRYSEAAGAIGKYARGKASPFAQVAIDSAAQSDFRGQPLPFSNDKVPASLRREGIGKYTYGKYAFDKMAPIPFEEAAREVWSDMGMNESEQRIMMDAIISFAAAGGTGIRYSKDFAKPTTGNR